MKNVTLAQFKRWARAHKGLAEAVCMAKAFAQLERARVDAYIKPIFDSFQFVDEDGAPITSPSQLYLSTDEALCKAFYAECDAAHRAHGFTGPEGVCPALRAEHLLIEAENHLIDAGRKLLGIKSMLVYSGQEREKMLDLLLGPCLKAA